MWKWLSQLIDFLKPVQTCPRCQLLAIEAIDIRCSCEWAEKQHLRQCREARGTETY